MVDWNRFTQHNSSTAWPSKWSSVISYGTAIAWGRAGLGSSHMERHNRKHGLVAATDNFNDGDTIQYRLLNTTMYTGYILYAKK